MRFRAAADRYLQISYLRIMSQDIDQKRDERMRQAS